MPKPRNIVGPTIRHLREKQSLTQEMFVAKLNLVGWDISRETLAKIESRIRWVADMELIQLAEGLRVDPGELLNMARRSLKTGKRT